MNNLLGEDLVQYRNNHMKRFSIIHTQLKTKLNKAKKGLCFLRDWSFLFPKVNQKC